MAQTVFSPLAPVAASSPLASLAASSARYEVHALVQRAIDDVADRLGVRPDLHLDWPVRTRVTTTVARAVLDALGESLARLSEHDGTTSAFVSVSWRDETVEVCVVDDGRAPARPRAVPLSLADSLAMSSAAHFDEATGVEHDVDDFGPAGTCQWWSIPTDL